MRRLVCSTCLALLPFGAFAQTDDRDYLTAFLEDSLSGAGRKVTVTGFEGLLSARATVQEITIADDAGIWLTLTGVTMDWSRSSLLTGEVRVSDLAAETIILERMPVAEAAAAPSPEASSFALPELPVSILIDHVGSDHIHLGPTILGQEVDARLNASMALAGGEGNINLALERTDAGPAGKVSLVASYANADQSLSVDLDAAEAANGIAATLLGIPGAPSTALTVKGAGPLTDFTADVKLTTDEVERLAGQVSLVGVKGDGIGFAVDLAGDLAPMFLPDYATFFGNRIALAAKGTRWADGRLDLDDLALSAAAVQLNGAARIGSDGLPRSFALNGHIADPSGAPVLLPIPGEVQTRVGSADVALNFDAQSEEGWKADIALRNLDRADFKLADLHLDGSGRIARVEGTQVVGGTLTYMAAGLAPADPSLARALGPSISGDVSFRWREGDGVLTLQRLALAGPDYSMTVSGTLAGLGDAMTMQGAVQVSADDLSRFAGLAGRPIAGGGQIDLSGQGSVLTGGFDVEIKVTGRDLAMGVPQLDSALRGPSELTASLARDETGATLRSLHVAAGTIAADASGTVTSSGMDLTANLSVRDISGFGPGMRGAVSGTATVKGPSDALKMTLKGQARNLAIGQAQADRLLAGNSTVALGVTLRDGALMVDQADFSNPQVSVKAVGALRGDQQTVDVNATLNNLGMLLPEFPGALSVQGRLVQTASGTQVDLTGKGPGQINASVKGTLAPNFRSGDLAIKGTAIAGLANPFIAPRVISGQTSFDLRVNGPLAPGSASGSVTLSNARLADPMLPFTLNAISARADLSGGRARISANAAISTGGNIDVTGTASLTPNYDGDISVVVRNALLRDPSLYEVQAGANITIRGPLAGGATIAGRVDLADTELRVPSTGFSTAGGIPDLQHRYEPYPVRETRVRAGLVEQGSEAERRAQRRPYKLDLLISAPARIFIRGRGLDAELGGEVRLTGTTDGIVPIGSFNLIRGRLDILSRRLDLTQATLELQGAMVPFINVVATAQADGATVGVQIRGPADDPVVSFTSIPEMPQEEILAQFLFGSNVQNLSVLQAIELANAVRSLAGKGGEGMLAGMRRSIGLDNLDVKTNASGQSEITAGKYLTEKIYTEVTVDAKGQSEIHLNMDLTKSITVRGTATSTGDSSIGIMIEKDY